MLMSRHDDRKISAVTGRGGNSRNKNL